MIRSILKGLLVLILSVFILLIFFPVIFILFLPSLIIRIVISKVSSKTGKILSSGSALHASHSHPTVILPYLLEGTPNIRMIRDEFRDNILNAKDPSNGQLLYPELQQRVVTRWGYHFWEDCPSFNLCDHVKLLEGVDTLELDSQNGSFVLKNLCQVPWKESPPWELLIVPLAVTKNLENTPHFLILLKYNHAICDGYSLIKLFDKVHTPKITDKLVAPNYPKGFQNLGKLLTLPFKSSYDLAWIAVNFASVFCIWRQSDGNFKGEKDKTKLSNEINVESTDLLSVNELKEVASQNNVSLSALLIAILCGGLRKYFIEQGIKTPQDVILNFPLPLPSHPSKLRNHSTFGFIKLPLSEPCGENRLLNIHQQFQWLKQSSIPWTVWKFNQLVGSQPMWFLSRMINMATKTFSINFTNLQWSPEPVEMFGYPLKEVRAGVANCGGTRAMIFCFLTYNNRGRLFQVTDTNLLGVQNSPKLIEACLEELHEISKSNEWKDVDLEVVVSK